MMTKPISNNTIPHAENTEQTVIGTMITFPETIGTACALGVSKTWFYTPANRIYWETLLELHQEQSQEISFSSLVSRLESANRLEAVGGVIGITDILTKGGSSALFDFHLQELRKVMLRREVVLKLSEIRDHPEIDASTVLDELREMNTEPIQDDTLKNNLAIVIAEFETMLESGNIITGAGTGFPALDKALGGLNGGTLTVVGARPAMGKSIFGQNIAYNVARHLMEAQSSKRVLFLTLEMSAVEIIKRLLQQIAQLNINDIVRSEKKLTREKMRGFSAAAKCLKCLPLDVYDVAGLNINRIMSQVESKHRKNPFALVVLDYLQLIKGYSKKAQENTVEQVAEVSQGLKNLAKRLNIPVLALAQVNREAVKGGKAPTLVDLKGSGAIEQDADAVILLHRPSYYSENKDELSLEELEEMHLILAKNRHGETGSFKARFRGDIFLITDRTS